MRRLVLPVVLVLAALLAWPLIRTVLRYRAVHKVLYRPEARQRMSVVLTHRTFPGPSEHIQSVDLGYATFETGFTGIFSRVAGGEKGTCVGVSNATVQINLLEPFSPEARSPGAVNLVMSGANSGYPKSVAQLQAYLSDSVQEETRAENRQAASFWDLAWMTKDQFMQYVIDVMWKAGCCIGRNEVISFETLSSRGLIRIGETPVDRSLAVIVFSSLDMQRSVGCRVTMTKAAERDIGSIIESMARSFRFSIETIPSSDEIAQLIAQAGIQRKKKSQQ